MAHAPTPYCHDCLHAIPNLRKILPSDRYPGFCLRVEQLDSELSTELTSLLTNILVQLARQDQCPEQTIFSTNDGYLSEDLV